MTGTVDVDGSGRQSAISVGKALLVLDAFRRSGHTVGVSELALRSELPKSTVHRLLAQLVDSGYVMRCGPAYRLSIRAFELGSSYIHCSPSGLRQVAGRHLSSLFLHSQLVVSLAVLDDLEIVMLDKIESIRFPLEDIVEGSRMPALATAPGKAVAAFLDDDEVARLFAALPRLTEHTVSDRRTLRRQLAAIRDSGVAVEAQEARRGVTAVASPILIGDVPIAAVVAAGPTGRMDLQATGAAVLRTSRVIAQDFIAVREQLHDYGTASPFYTLLDQA